MVPAGEQHSPQVSDRVGNPVQYLASSWLWQSEPWMQYLNQSTSQLTNAHVSILTVTTLPFFFSSTYPSSVYLINPSVPRPGKFSHLRTCQSSYKSNKLFPIALAPSCKNFLLLGMGLRHGFRHATFWLQKDSYIQEKGRPKILYHMATCCHNKLCIRQHTTFSYDSYSSEGLFYDPWG